MCVCVCFCSGVSINMSVFILISVSDGVFPAWKCRLSAVNLCGYSSLGAADILLPCKGDWTSVPRKERKTKKRLTQAKLAHTPSPPPKPRDEWKGGGMGEGARRDEKTVSNMNPLQPLLHYLCPASHLSPIWSSPSACSLPCLCIKRVMCTCERRGGSDAPSLRHAWAERIESSCICCCDEMRQQ